MYLEKRNHATKQLQTAEEVKHYFLGFLAFIDITEQHIRRPVDNKRKKDVLYGKEKNIYSKDTAYG